MSVDKIMNETTISNTANNEEDCETESRHRSCHHHQLVPGVKMNECLQSSTSLPISMNQSMSGDVEVSTLFLIHFVSSVSIHLGMIHT